VKAAPSGLEWVHEIKFDGWRLMVRRKVDRVHIYTRRGADWTKRFPKIVEAVRKLGVESFLIDGEGQSFSRFGQWNTFREPNVVPNVQLGE
jgi:ATP-dependent DNA ligase